MQPPDETMLEELALVIPAGEAAQYFYGDNLEGYYEGYTYQTNGGSGYWIDGKPVFRDVRVSIDARACSHEQARGAEILPHAIRHHHAAGTVEFSLLHRQRAVAITITPRRDSSRVSCAIQFDVCVGHITATAKPHGIALKFSGLPMAAALSATAPLSGVAASGHAVSVDAKGGGPVTIYLAFAATHTKALSRARALVKSDGRAEHVRAIGDIIGRSSLVTSDARYNRAVAWSKLTSYFLVTEEFGKGIWAGLPWFKNNWGRDTFIALPGTLLVSGMFDDARDVILNFLRYQDTNPKSVTYGRVPNRVQSATDIIYNTADGTPWLIRELYEYLQYTGDLSLTAEVYPAVKLAIEGAIKTFVDAEEFLTHDDADTWMDARIMGDLPWSARGNRANDIQALWHNTLLIGSRLAGYAGDRKASKAWSDRADRLRTHFIRRFWNPRTKLLADRITSTNRRDQHVRPNQLMVISIPMIEPLLNETQEQAVVAHAVGALLYPHGIASLSQDDPYFHPYHHNDTWHHFDAAYHNGTVWGWNAGFAVTAMCRVRQTELAWKLACNLTRQVLDLGCRGSMSELIEAIPREKNKLTLSGTWAQAWSTSEFARNAYQDFGGFQPRLLDGEVHLHPHLPTSWTDFEAVFPFGRGATLHVSFTRWEGLSVWHVRMEGHPEPLTLHLTLDQGNRRYAVEEPLLPGQPVLVEIDAKHARLNHRISLPSVALPKVTPLKFRVPSLAAKPASIRTPHYLQRLIESGHYC